MFKINLKKLLLFILVPILCIYSLNAQPIINKTAGIGFRVDDNHSVANFTQYAGIFKKYGFNFTFAINMGHSELAKFEGLPGTIKYLRSLGNEMADHTPDHNTKYFLVDDVSSYYGLAGVDHILADKKKICIAIEKISDTTYKDEGRINISGNTIISVNNGEFHNPGAMNTFHIPALKALYTFDSKDIKNSNPSDPDTILNLKDFWGEDITLAPMQNLEYYKMGSYDVHMSHPGLMLMAKRTLELCSQSDLDPPICWIQPGGYFPQVNRDDVSLTYGTMGYKSGAVYPEASYKFFNEYDPIIDKAYSMDWGDFCEDFWPLDSVETIIADRAARHIVSFGHSHFWDLFGGWDNYINRTDSLLAWCKANSIPVRTYTEWADILYRTPQNPYCNVMPKLDIDIDNNRRPDGFSLGSSTVLDTLDGVPTSSNRSLSVTSPIDARILIFQIGGLGGVEKGDNYFSFWAKGTPKTEVDLQLWYNEVQEGISFKFVIKDTTWTKYDLLNSVNGNTQLIIPDKNSKVILSMTIAYIPSSGGFVKLSGMELRKNTSKAGAPPPWLGKPEFNNHSAVVNWDNNTSEVSAVCVMRKTVSTSSFVTIDSVTTPVNLFKDNLSALPDSLRKYDTLTIYYQIIVHSNGNASESNIDSIKVSTLDIWPLELNSFTCNNVFDKVELKWENKYEKYNSGFEVERKLSGAWAAIGFLKGEPNSSSSKSYLFYDSLQYPNVKVKYRLKQIDVFGKFRFSDSVSVVVLPSEYGLFQNYPNPFNPITNIRYSVNSPGIVTLKLYDILGRLAATLVNQYKEAGNYTYQLDARNISSGVYFYSIKINNFNKTKKMVVVK